ncbi:MAG: formylglycine-generating enzyme family protein [Henriciella sp.]
MMRAVKLSNLAGIMSIVFATACGQAVTPQAGADLASAQADCGLDADLFGRFVEVPGGVLETGQDAIYPEEQNRGTFVIEPFAIQAHEVTVDQFRAFVEVSGYITDAERSVAEGRLGAGSAYFSLPRDGLDPSWQIRDDVRWDRPDGPESIANGQHPVVHISRNDAAAYAVWAGGRLPSEFEWEYAARLGTGKLSREDAGIIDADGTAIANAWQGIFPVANTGDDGFLGTAPVGCFPPDQTGLYDMLGNVWEWTDSPYTSSDKVLTIKGGSYLCADNFCRRYRPAARQSQEIDFSTNHIGFRIVKDVTD